MSPCSPANKGTAGQKELLIISLGEGIFPIRLRVNFVCLLPSATILWGVLATWFSTPRLRVPDEFPGESGCADSIQGTVVRVLWPGGH